MNPFELDGWGLLDAALEQVGQIKSRPHLISDDTDVLMDTSTYGALDGRAKKIACS